MIEVQVGEHITQIENDVVLDSEFEVDFNGELLVLISNDEDGVKIINAMDGYGYNKRSEYENVTPIFRPDC